jgi:hypothetical protein
MAETHLLGNVLFFSPFIVLFFPFLKIKEHWLLSMLDKLRLLPTLFSKQSSETQHEKLML